MIKLTAIGHLGKDCEVRDVNGQIAISFNIAHSTNYTNQEGVKIDKTVWLSCTIWKQKTQSIKVADYLTKGQQVYLEGVPQADYYQNKEGEIVPQLRVRVNHVQLLGSSSTAKTREAGQEEKPADYEQLPDSPADDLPF